MRRLLPEVSADDLERGGAGVRAQALLHDGKFVDDFMIRTGSGVVNVYNAPSPAATASLAIGEHVGDVALKVHDA